MSTIHLINQVLEWERRSDYQAEHRKYHPDQPYVNYLAGVLSALTAGRRNPPPAPSKAGTEAPCLPPCSQAVTGD
jgi:hypothetical protein